MKIRAEHHPGAGNMSRIVNSSGERIWRPVQQIQREFPALSRFAIISRIEIKEECTDGRGRDHVFIIEPSFLHHGEPFQHRPLHLHVVAVFRFRENRHCSRVLPGPKTLRLKGNTTTGLWQLTCSYVGVGVYGEG